MQLEANCKQSHKSSAATMATLPQWRNPKLNNMGVLFDYQMWKMISTVGWPANEGCLLSRNDGQFSDSDYIQLDVGGEGYHEAGGIVSGFNSAINVNNQKFDSQSPSGNIPHLVLVKNGNYFSEYPFQKGFADYMTMQDPLQMSVNIPEIARCIRPGGEIGLWINDNSAIIKLANKLSSYVEWKAWDEFATLGDVKYGKKRIPVPGADYMIRFSMSKNWFFIQRVFDDGTLGHETDKGSWKFDYNALATFKIRGQTYVFGWSVNYKYWFIQELLPNGKLGKETQTGEFKFDYQVMKTAQIGGRTYLIGHSDAQKYLFIQELREGGKLGDETFRATNVDYEQVAPFTSDGQTYLFLCKTSSYKWQIRRLYDNADGWTLTDSGDWGNPHKVIVVNVLGNPILFGQNPSSRYWFLQRINKDGKMGRQTNSGRWGYVYDTLSTFTHGEKAYIFGQNSSGTNNWFIQNVLSSGKMGSESDHENWKFAYENVEFYTQYK